MIESQSMGGNELLSTNRQEATTMFISRAFISFEDSICYRKTDHST